MRVSQVKINGKDYPICFSTGVVAALEERGNGDYSAELIRVTGSKKPSEMLWIIHQVLEAGRRLAEINGDPHPGALSLEDLHIVFGLDDLVPTLETIMELISKDSKPTVETVPEKNAEATPGA